MLASLSKVAKSLRLLPHEGYWQRRMDRNGARDGSSSPRFQPSAKPFVPLQSVWIDMLVLRLLNEPKAHQKRVWFVLDELASLQPLPQFHTALTENRKSHNPIIMGFPGSSVGGDLRPPGRGHAIHADNQNFP